MNCFLFFPNTLNHKTKLAAARDLADVPVSSILDHRIEGSNMTFLVKFVNDNESWKPLGALRDNSRTNEHLLDYCSQHDIQLPPRERKKK
ncbi:hypothetical protein GEMRC1_005056 [Eukaryota sp. GEM-RC1]